MQFLCALILSLVILYVKCSPILNAKHKPKQIVFEVNNFTDSFNDRRRDLPPIQFPNPIFVRSPYEDDTLLKKLLLTTTETPVPKKIPLSSRPLIFSNNKSESIARNILLIPDLDVHGKPKCLSNPSDTYCEIVSNYPNITVKHDIGYTPDQFLEIFGTKNIDGRKSYQDDDIAEERVCRRYPKVIYPQMAKNQENQWVYVVNEVKYTQAVVAEVCEKEGKPCAYLDSNHLPTGMSSQCRQKFSYKRLLAVHPTEKRTYPDTFKFPSCCACYVKSPLLFGRNLRMRTISR